MSDAKIIEALRQAINITPDNIPLREHLAAILIEAGKQEEAKIEFEEALKYAPNNIPLHLKLSQLLYHFKRYEAAAIYLRDVLKLDNKCAEAHFEMAKVLIALEQFEMAQKSYHLATDINPNLADSNIESHFSKKESSTPRLLHAGPELKENAFKESSEFFGISESPQITFNDVGGMEELKEEIRINIIYPFTHPEVYAAYGKKIGGGILLYGPPGCGKTYVARATAGECKAHFIAVGIEEILDMWMGESERRLHELFETARAQSPCVLFFDELEAFAGKRSDMQHSPHFRTVVNQLLAEMDGAKGDNQNILVIGATNSPWHVDSAFRRPGRFDKVIFVPPPDLTARKEILKIHCKGKPVDNLDYEKIALKMKKFSGADIRAICDIAAEFGLRETLKTGKMRLVKMADFLEALKKIRPTTDEWLNTAKNYVLYSNQAGLYDPIVEYLQKGKD